MPQPVTLKKLKLNGSMKTYKTLKDVLFVIGDWNAKVGSQETPRVTGKFDLGMQNEAGQRLIEFFFFFFFNFKIFNSYMRYQT